MREGASLAAHGVVVEDCLQGIMAYGGAHAAHVQGCTILRTKKEGLLASGSYENAATRAQALKVDGRSKVSREADAWAKRHGIGLQVMSRCGVREFCLHVLAGENLHFLVCFMLCGWLGSGRCMCSMW